MKLELKDIITISLSTASFLILLYNLWDSRRKKLKIYFGSGFEVKNEILMHLLTFSVINKSTRPLQIYDTRFYIQHLSTNKRWYLLLKRHTSFNQISFGSTEGHLYDQSLAPDTSYKISLEACEIFTNGLEKNTSEVPTSIMIKLIDLDGKTYRKKVGLNLLNHDQNAKLRLKQFCFPKYYFKEEGKMRKEQQKSRKAIARAQQKPK